MRPFLLSQMPVTDMVVPPDVIVPILVVDDNAGKRLALNAVLSPLGHRIVEADSGRSALRCLMEENFAVILLDVRMPDMDGFETATYIRQRRQSEMTPIIFITAHGPDEIAQAERFVEGAVDFMFAPVPPAELRAKVSVFANLYIRAELLARRARAVQTSADQLRMLTDAAPIGIFQTDPENRYRYTNPRWSEITGMSSDDATGQEWTVILGPDERAALEAAMATGAIAAGEISQRFGIRHPACGDRTVLVTATAIPGHAGTTAGWVGTLADVTVEAHAEVVMSNARDAALAATLMQQHFAALASHELKTPTSSILGFLEEVLANDGLSPEDRGFLDIVYQNAQRLNRLIDDLLIVGQTEIGVVRMSCEPTPLGPLVDRVVANLAGQAQRAGISVATSHGDDPPDALVDPLRLEQALTNLLINAFKFTPPGGEVTVDIHQDGDVVDVSVADNGSGIAPAEIDKVFDRFFRTQAAIDGSIKGSGLGLAIAKGMIEAQNGVLRVTSALGLGSTFTMSLPVAAREVALD